MTLARAIYMGDSAIALHFVMEAVLQLSNKLLACPLRMQTQQSSFTAAHWHI